MPIRKKTTKLESYDCRVHFTLTHKGAIEIIRNMEALGGNLLQRYIVSAIESFSESEAGKNMAVAHGVPINFIQPPIASGQNPLAPIPAPAPTASPEPPAPPKRQIEKLNIDEAIGGRRQ